MKAAIVRGAGQAPVYGDFTEPMPAAQENRVAVTAAALSPLSKVRAAGTHYSSSGRFPFIAGIDGVGRLDDGRRVYFVVPTVPFGSMAERTVVPASQCVPLPDGLDDITAAAIANPGMSSWAAYTERAHVAAGETVLVNGATGAAGRLAVQIAKHFGARKVIATGRNTAALRSLAALGADATIALGASDAELEQRFKDVFADGVDVVVDYLWGKSAELLLTAAAKASADGVPLRFVQVGSASGADISLPGVALRAAAIELMGSGIGSVRLDRLVGAIDGVLRAAASGGLDIATTAVPLVDVERAWSHADGTRTVFTVQTQACTNGP